MTFASLYMLVSITISWGISRTITGRSIVTGMGDPLLRFVVEGDSLPEGDYAFVAFYNMDTQTVKVTYRDSTLWDSLYYEYIPGDRFYAYLLAQVEWSTEHEALEYTYTIISEHTSLVPIRRLDVEKKVDCIEMFGPRSYLADNSLRDHYEWSNFREPDLVMPGNRLSGCGIRCTCPPVLGWFDIWGQPKEVDEYLDDAWDRAEMTGAKSYNQSVRSTTIVPGPCPERIEPVDWVMRVALGIYDFIDYGYLDDQEVYAIYPILSNLAASLRDSVNQNLDSLEVRVNETLTQLEPVVAPPVNHEARGYIMENLRYILRNPDKVRFKMYRY
jgi:hypothetical protein